MVCIAVKLVLPLLLFYVDPGGVLLVYDFREHGMV